MPFERRNNVLTGTETVEFGNLFRVVVYPRGAYVRDNGTQFGQTIPLLEGHSFRVGDKALFDPGGNNIVTGFATVVTPTSVRFGNDSFQYFPGMRIANVNVDSAGTGVLDFKASTMTIHPPENPTPYLNASVNCDTQGNYAYNYNGDGGAWELIIGVDNIAAGVVDGFSGEGGERVNVFDYGVGDGTEDAERIELASRAVPVGGELFLPGVYDYLMKASAKINRGDITIQFGTGAKLVVDSPEGIAIKCLHINSGGAGSLPIENITVNGLRADDPDPDAHFVPGGEESHGMVVSECANLIINDAHVSHMGDEGIDLIICRDVLVDGLILDGNGAISGEGGGLGLGGCDRVTVRNVQILSQDNGPGIKAISSTGGEVHGHLIIDTVHAKSMLNTKVGEGFGTPIQVQSAAAGAIFRGLHISNVHCDEAPRPGIELVTQNGGIIEDFAISGCVIRGGGQEAGTGGGVQRGGINCDGGAINGSITGNVIEDWGVAPPTTNHYGIRAAGEGVVVTGNSMPLNANNNRAIYYLAANAASDQVVIDNNFAPGGVLSF